MVHPVITSFVEASVTFPDTVNCWALSDTLNSKLNAIATSLVFYSMTNDISLSPKDRNYLFMQIAKNRNAPESGRLSNINQSINFILMVSEGFYWWRFNFLFNFSIANSIDSSGFMVL